MKYLSTVWKTVNESNKDERNKKYLEKAFSFHFTPEQKYRITVEHKLDVGFTPQRLNLKKDFFKKNCFVFSVLQKKTHFTSKIILAWDNLF